MNIGDMNISYIIGYCGACCTKMVYNPSTVPAIPCKGMVKPLCLSCVGKINHARAMLEMPQFAIVNGTYTTLNELFKVDDDTELTVVIDSSSYTGQSKDNPNYNPEQARKESEARRMRRSNG